MDILVTIPKREMNNIKKEDAWLKNQKPGEAVQFWSMSRIPKDIHAGDRVYFVEAGAVRYYHELLSISNESSMKCEATDRVWGGPALILTCPPVTLKNPVPMKGFQGFRYVERGTFS